MDSERKPMIFRLDGRPGSVMAVTLLDVVRAITAADPGLNWVLTEFYGAGNPEVLYPGDRTYEDFTKHLESTSSLTPDELLSTAVATSDIYDVLIVGVRGSEAVKRYVGSNPELRFKTLASQYPVVAECVDSGFWRISVEAETAAEEVRHLLAAIPGVAISECFVTGA
jgi:hypothetical protein